MSASSVLDWATLDNPVEDGGAGRTEALRTLHTPDYESQYTEKELNHICHYLDLSIVFKLGYSACQDFSRSILNGYHDVQHTAAYTQGRVGTVTRARRKG